MNEGENKRGELLLGKSFWYWFTRGAKSKPRSKSGSEMVVSCHKNEGDDLAVLSEPFSLRNTKAQKNKRLLLLIISGRGREEEAIGTRKTFLMGKKKEEREEKQG
ncbi:MAG: hypothetical protein GF308_21905 [Candidatus Heimdallarchaeota archaeon]|nr:hypothetical protein [Candidatus Heimdallarchaeota archaeon]